MAHRHCAGCAPAHVPARARSGPSSAIHRCPGSDTRRRQLRTMKAYEQGGGGRVSSPRDLSHGARSTAPPRGEARGRSRCSEAELSDGIAEPRSAAGVRLHRSVAVARGRCLSGGGHGGASGQPERLPTCDAMRLCHWRRRNSCIPGAPLFAARPCDDTTQGRHRAQIEPSAITVQPSCRCRNRNVPLTSGS